MMVVSGLIFPIQDLSWLSYHCPPNRNPQHDQGWERNETLRQPLGDLHIQLQATRQHLPWSQDRSEHFTKIVKQIFPPGHWPGELGQPWGGKEMRLFQLKSGDGDVDTKEEDAWIDFIERRKKQHTKDPSGIRLKSCITSYHLKPCFTPGARFPCKTWFIQALEMRTITIGTKSEHNFCNWDGRTIKKQHMTYHGLNYLWRQPTYNQLYFLKVSQPDFAALLVTRIFQTFSMSISMLHLK